MDLPGKVALVTGGARGIGRSIAERLAGEGCHIAVVDLDESVASETAAAIANSGVTAVGFGCDVSSYGDVEKLSESVHRTFDGVDILVNNAGIARDRLLLRMKPEDWNIVIGVNLGGVFNCCKFFGPPMLKRRVGTIINIASVVGQMGNAGQVNYAASKAGVIGVTKSLSKEFASRGITVNAIAPGFIRTAMTEALTEDQRNTMKQGIPLGRFGEPGDVADIALFLVSNQASYVTGQVINCDGGMVMAR